MENNEKVIDEFKTVKVVTSGVLTISFLFISAWLAFKGSLLCVPVVGMSLMAFHTTLMKRYR